MNFPKKTALATLLLLSATNAFAAGIAELTITGTVAPGACSFNFTTNNGVINYTIDPTTLSPTDETDLEPKEMAYTIGCTAPIKVATTWMDNQADSRPDDFSFGLGKHEGVKIGYYKVMSKRTATGDGSTVNVIAQDTDMNGGNWITLDESVPLLHPSTRYMSFMANGNPTIEPAELQNYSGTFVVKTTINKTSTLNMNTQVKLDGSSTVSLHYP